MLNAILSDELVASIFRTEVGGGTNVIGFVHGGRHRLIILWGRDLTMGMRAFNLRASQVRKMGKIGLT
jgi:hypothetical protein